MGMFGSLLERVRVAAPCPADWGEMRGDERVRFCDRCNLNVYNLSAMTRREAERLVLAREGRLCVRFYRRADQTVLTRNCPVGLRALKRRVSRLGSAVAAAAVGFFAGVGVAPQSASRAMSAPPSAEEVAAVAAAEAAEAEAADVETAYTEVMGGMIGGPLDSPFVVGSLIGGALFAVGYPLHKLRERRQARQRESLRIWRG